MLNYYFCDYQNEEDVSGETPRSGDLRKVLAAFGRMSDSDGNFFGVVAGTKTIQFIVADDGLWEVDVPMPERAGSLTGLRLEQRDCSRLIALVANGGEPSEIEGLSFVPWADAS